MAKKKFFITTAIDYMNAPVHLGHSLEKIQADVLARYHRLLGEEVLFLTGTDENAQKNVLAAEKIGIPVKKFIDKNVNFAKKTWKALSISFDQFIRTTDKKRHWPGVKKIWLKCKESGDIYKRKYTGLYCSECEAFVKEKDLKNGLCSIHLKPPQKISEENYFFRLSKYQKDLEGIVEEGVIKIVPEERKNEVLNFIKSGLEDLSISRPIERMKRWGIPVPGDEKQIVYVWLDALTNYISALGYGREEKNFKKYWPANIQVVGKDIIRFHAIYWPAILLSAKITLPKQILIHGFLTINGQKMSKSLGNVIEPSGLVNKYRADAVRYFLLREIPPFEDGDFTYGKFEKKYNSDLSSGLGNLVSRVLTMAEKTNIKKATFPQVAVRSFINTSKIDYRQAMKTFKFNEALGAVWQLIGTLDRYIERERPWEDGKNNKRVISDLMFALEEIAQLLKPFLPETSEQILKQLKIKKRKPLFPRI